MNLRTDRKIDRMDSINMTLLAIITKKLNDYDDDEFKDVLQGNRSISVKVCDNRCICGDIGNIPCQWFAYDGQECNGNHCSRFIDRQTVKSL